MNRALVLSGGGGKGAFQVGALKYIFENMQQGKDPYFNIIAGVSAGALNGIMLVMDKFDELVSIWENIKNHEVYKGEYTAFHAISRMLRGKNSILDNSPLHDLIISHTFLEDIKSDKYDLRIGMVSLKTGKYYSFSVTDFDNNDDLRNAILASSSIPVIWPPVDRLTTRDGRQYDKLVDGGIRNMTPLGDILNDEPDEVIIINCNQEEIGDGENPDRNMIRIAERALAEITVNEIFKRDVEQFLQINHILSQLPPEMDIRDKKGRILRRYPAIVINPRHSLGNTLDFSKEMIRFRMEEGYLMAKEAYEASMIKA